MNLKDHRKVPLLDLVDMERAKKGVVYREGSIKVQISATKGQTHYLCSDQEVESHFVVFRPKPGVCGEYLCHVLQEELPQFLYAYQTGLNIKPEIFEHMKVDFHTDSDTQKHIASIMRAVGEEIEVVHKQIEAFNDLKSYHLDKMFAKGVNEPMHHEDHEGHDGDQLAMKLFE